MKQILKYIYLYICFLSITSLTAQELLFFENFNECALPAEWVANISYGDGEGFYIGQPTNDNSDSTSIDGSCMMVFDDDILGDNTPSFVAEVSTPAFSTMGYNTIRFQTDISFRAYGTSIFSVYVEESDGNRVLLAEYGEGQQTGNQFSDFAPLSLDLSFFTVSPELKLVYIYDDKEMYAWYAGIDNVEVIGSGEGEVIVIEQFNDCEIPEGWSTNVLEGEQDWVFGLFDNDKSSATSMNSSCFVFFDDDKIGRDAPFSTLDLMTPWFDGTQYATFILELELIFRRYGDFENISIYVNDGENIKLVKEFFDAVGGPQITNYLPIQVDLTEYRSTNMQVVFRYDDGNEWGWWTGLDNIKIIGNGSINDLCDKSEVLEIGKACLSSENKNAVFSGPPNTCFANGEGSLWYSMTAPEDGIIKLSNDANYNDIITIYSGVCDALNEIHCENKDEHGFEGEEVIFDVMKGETYMVRISGVDADYGLSRGRNCITANYINQIPQASTEDVISMAIPLTVNASPSSINNTFGNIGSTLPEDNLLARSDLWYTFNSGEIQNVEIDVSANFAENTVVYDNDMNEIHAQIEGGKFQVYDLNPNTNHYIQISGTFAIIEGGAEIALTAVDSVEPESDDCFDPTEILVGEEITYDNMGQSFSGQNSSCDIYGDKDRWFSFVADGNSLYLNLESDFVTNAALYKGSCEALEEVICHSGIATCDGSISLHGLDENQIYYIQISESQTNNNNTSNQVSFSLSHEPIELPDFNINVSAICLEDGQAELQILITSEVPYTLEGNAHGDILFEGDSYIVVATPEVGCEKIIKGVINCQGTSCNLKVESALTYPSCSGALDGSVSLDIQNGLGPFSFSWEHTNDDVAEFVSLGSGEYQVTVTDALGCISTSSVMIVEPNPIVSSVNSTDQIIADAEDGTASIDIAGGTLPYTIDWSNGATSESIDNLPPGEYSVTITDYNGCTASHDFIVGELNCAFQVEADVIHVTCNGDLEGSISLSSTSDIESVEWDNNDSGTSISNLESGVYTATISLINGCKKIESYTIVEPEEITVEVDIADVKCFGESNGAITPMADGGNGDFTYEWGDGNTDQIRTDLLEGEYMLLVRDHLGCEALHTFSVIQPDLLEVASSMVADLSCADSQDGQICVFVEGGTQPYQFDWEDLEDGMSKMTDLTAGNYSLVVTDHNQCSLTSEQTISAPEQLEVSLEDISITEGDDGYIKIDVSGGVEPYEITWYLNGVVVGAGDEISDLLEGIYSAVIIDANGCKLDSPEYLLSPTSTSELEPSIYSVYPNPSKGAFTIAADNLSKKAKVKVVSVTGQDLTHLVDFGFNGEMILGQNQGLLTGLYFLEISIVGQSNLERLPLIISK